MSYANRKRRWQASPLAAVWRDVPTDRATGRSLRNNLNDELNDTSTDSESSSSIDEDGVEEIYFACAVDSELCDSQQVELDIAYKQCADLRRLLRNRPTLPLKADGNTMSVEDLNVGVKLPLYSCPFLGVDGKPCHFHTNDRHLFLHHVAGGVLDTTHVPKQIIMEAFFFRS